MSKMVGELQLEEPRKPTDTKRQMVEAGDEGRAGKSEVVRWHCLNWNGLKASGADARESRSIISGPIIVLDRQTTHCICVLQQCKLLYSTTVISCTS